MSKNSLIAGLQNASNSARTANGDKAFASTLNNVLDLFSRGGSMRGRASEAVRLFDNAYGEDKQLALRCAFYLRDVREGQGEREFFRAAILHLAKVDASSLRKNLHLIPEFGRWDDVLVLLNTSLKKDVIELIKAQWSKDIDAANKGQATSLLARWLPSPVTSSKETVKQARQLAEGLGLSEKVYRKTRAALNKKLGTVEIAMSGNAWEGVNYNQVPSSASKIYRKAFKKHDDVRYTSWVAEVQQNIALKAAGKEVVSTAKVNSATLYPYEIVRDIRSGKFDQSLQNQWNSLPNYAGEGNVLVMSDTSGSMESGCGSVPPIDVALSLAVYFAERNEGIFKNHFLTFSDVPQLVTLKGSTLQSKIQNIQSIVANTDLRAAFRLVLDTAIRAKAPASDMPKAIVVISDMQFDAGCNGRSTLEDLKQMYMNAGYVMPACVWWNVNSSDNSPCKADSRGNILVSGSSVNTFKYVNAYLESKKLITPADMMEETLNSARYSEILV